MALIGASRATLPPSPISSSRERNTEPIPENDRAAVLVTFAVSGDMPRASSAG